MGGKKESVTNRENLEENYSFNCKKMGDENCLIDEFIQVRSFPFEDEAEWLTFTNSIIARPNLADAADEAFRRLVLRACMRNDIELELEFDPLSQRSRGQPN